MEQQARNVVGPTRNSSMSKVRRFKSDLAALKREVNKSVNTFCHSDHTYTYILFPSSYEMNCVWYVLV